MLPLSVTNRLSAYRTLVRTYDAATAGLVSYDPATRKLTWVGAPATEQAVNIIYPVTVTQGGTFIIENTARLTTASGSTFTDNASVMVEPYQIFLPCILKKQ